MKNLICSCLILFIPCLLLTAQDDPLIVAYSINGKVKYAPKAGAKMERLRPGTELAPESIIKIYPGANLGIVYDEEYGVVNAEGEQTVAAITENISLFDETDLSELFGKSIDKAYNPYLMVRSGFSVAGDPPPPPPSKPTKDGAGNKDFRIIRLQPAGGKVSGDQIHFSWKPADPAADIKHYAFILRSADDEILLEKTVKGTDFILTPEDYGLNPGKNYQWQVSAEQDEALKTPAIPFACEAASTRAKIRNDLKADKMYSMADPVAQKMIEANVLEQAGFLSEAYDLYTTAAEKNKKNQLAQLLLQAFEWRHDMIE